MHGKSSSHGYKPSLGFFATIRPTPPARFTAAEAVVTANLRPLEVMQRTTFPATMVLLSERDSHTLQKGT